MKYKISTYLDFLELKPVEVNKIIDDDFDLYSDDEMRNVVNFIAKFNNTIYDITHKSISTMVIEEKTINILNYTNGELLAYFKEHPNE